VHEKFWAWLAQADGVLQVDNAELDRLRAPSTAEGWSFPEQVPAQSLLAVPLTAGRTLVGALVVWRETTKARCSASDRQLLEWLAPWLSLVIENAEAGRRAEAKQQHTAEELARVRSECEEFVYIASHDLQSPLHKIQFFVQLLERDCAAKLNETGQTHFIRLKRGVSQLIGMVRDLLLLSRVKPQAKPLEPVELNEVTRAVLAAMQEDISSACASVSVGDLPTVLGDQQQLGQLLENLLSNSLRFRNPSVPLIAAVSACPTNDTCLLPDGSRAPAVEIVVQDNGIGFDNIHAERIFKPFERLHAAGASSGTGMGLAICRRIVERHGGTIGCTSSPGAGVRIVVRLPLTGPRGRLEGT
jgi:light-regulated signal transduction histidine kinase (bacteriophytochrome)